MGQDAAIGDHERGAVAEQANVVRSAIGITAAVASFVMLSSALKSLPVGTAYAVWVGIGALGVALAGMVALGESASPLRLGFLTLILVGIIGLKVVEG
jgi:quaternary ammonium compound-resistance protein SugE